MPPGTWRGSGTPHAASGRRQVCPAPPPASPRALGAWSRAHPRGLPDSLPRGRTHLRPVGGASPDKGRKASPRRRRPPSLPSPPPHVRPGGPRQPRADDSAGRPLTPPRGSPPLASRRSLGSHPARTGAHPSSPSPRPSSPAELRGNPPHTWRGTASTCGSVPGRVTARVGEDARRPGPCHPLKAGGGGRAATGALAVLHMRRCKGCSPSQGPLSCGLSNSGTTFPISLWACRCRDSQEGLLVWRVAGA